MTLTQKNGPGWATFYDGRTLLGTVMKLQSGAWSARIVGHKAKHFRLKREAVAWGRKAAQSAGKAESARKAKMVEARVMNGNFVERRQLVHPPKSAKSALLIAERVLGGWLEEQDDVPVSEYHLFTVQIPKYGEFGVKLTAYKL